MPRLCKRPGCPKSMVGKRRNADYCSVECRNKAQVERERQRNGRVPRINPSGLTRSQVKILEELAKTKGALHRGLIVEITGLARGTVGDNLGHVNLDSRAAYEKKTGRPSLLTLGLVEEVELDIDGRLEIGHRLTDPDSADRQSIF